MYGNVLMLTVASFFLYIQSSVEMFVRCGFYQFFNTLYTIAYEKVKATALFSGVFENLKLY
uniref:ABC transmembrane type-1 domain-containing protein n=1 Tax=Solanum lycopersicum TaxID=4081 RepID=A0A3Q7FR59_SOLLC